MPRFDTDLHTLIASVYAGKSAQIVAPWGRGATTVLDSLSVRLQLEDYAVIAVRGAPYTRTVDFFALRQADPGAASNRELRSFSAFLDQAVEHLERSPLRAILVDGLEHVDRATLSVLQAAAHATSTPVVSSRSRDIRSLMASSPIFAQFGGRRVELSPMDLDSVAALAYERLGEWPDAELASRILSKSAGNIGLAVAVLDGARSNGLIALHGDRWVMVADDLWSGEIEAWIDEHLSLLAPAEYDVVERIAASTIAPGQSPAHIDPAMMKALDTLGLLAVDTGGGAGRLVVHPPAIADYFRRCRTSDVMKHRRVDEDDHSPPGDAPQSAQDLSINVAAFRSSLEAGIGDLAEAWEARQDVASAIAYVVAVLDVPRREQTIQRVFAETPLATALSGEDAFDFIHLQITWAGTAQSRTPGLAQYSEVAALFPEWDEQIAGFVEAMKNGPRHLPRVPSGSPLTLASGAYAHLVAGNVDAAALWASHVPEKSHLFASEVQRTVQSLVPLARGDFAAALLGSRQGSTEARAALDQPGIILHAYSHSLTLIALARWRDARDVVTSALSFGPPGTAGGVLYRALLHIGAFVHHYLGDGAVAKRLIAEAEHMHGPEVRLPGTQAGVATVIRLLIEGQPARAMREIRNLADVLEASGGTLAADMTLRAGLMIWPDEPTLAQLDEMLPDDTFRTVRHIVRTSFTSLPAAADAASDELAHSTQLPYLAQVIASRAKQTTEHDRASVDDPDLQAAMARLEASLPLATQIGESPGHSHDFPRVLLTPREQQIAALIRTRSNAVIAEMLHLSVRTVENHIYSAMKKHGVTSRDALRARMAAESV